MGPNQDKKMQGQRRNDLRTWPVSMHFTASSTAVNLEAAALPALGASPSECAGSVPVSPLLLPVPVPGRARVTASGLSNGCSGLPGGGGIGPGPGKPDWVLTN